MAEKIISPGVFTRENDLSFVQQGVAQIGAAIVGPTVKGPALIPTQVFSYSEYQALYGDSFKSGSNYFQYLTSITAKEYLKHGGPATIVRVMPTDAGNANSHTHLQQISNAGTGPSASSGAFKALTDATILQYTHSDGTAYQFIGETGVIPQDIPSLNYYYFDIGANVAATLTNLASEINTVIGAGTATSHSSGGTGTLGLTGSATTTATNITFKSGSTTSTGVGAVAIAFSGPGAVTGVLTSGSTFSSNDVSFQLRTHTDGAIMNSRPGYLFVEVMTQVRERLFLKLGTTVHLTLMKIIILVL